MTEFPTMPMEQARKNLSDLGHRALVEKTSTLVTNHGRPFFVICPPGGAMPLYVLDQKLREAIAADDDAALAGVADEIEQAGLALLADVVRTRKTAGLRALLGG
ncbi:MAG TPA: hypothetical protein VKZ82_10565 [Nonomuraea sp.]|nr:hypothetical protein [Nonomuraea sp.]